MQVTPLPLLLWYVHSKMELGSLTDSCIRQVPIFEHLTEQEIILLKDVIRSRCYEKGEFIFREGERSETLYVLHHGIVKLSKCSGTGKEQIIRFLFPTDFFGQFSLLHERTHYAHAEVLAAATICLIHKSDFNELMENNPAMTHRFLLAVSDRLHQADEWMSTISLLDVEERLAKILLLFYQKEYPRDLLLKLPIAKKELAALIGTTPETLSRKLSFLESRHVLASESRNRIRILNLDELTKFANT